MLPEITDKPMLFEVFTDSKDESDALFAVRNIERKKESATKKMARNLLGEKGIQAVKKVLGK